MIVRGMQGYYHRDKLGKSLANGNPFKAGCPRTIRQKSFTYIRRNVVVGIKYLTDTTDTCPHCGGMLQHVEEEVPWEENRTAYYYRCYECRAEFDIDDDRIG